MILDGAVHRICTALGLALALLAPGAVSAQIAVPPLLGHVADQTGTLTAAQKSTLEQTLSAFEARKGSQLAVLIVPTTTPEVIEQFALRVAEQWKLGRKKVDDGAILVVAKNDRALRIEVGYGLEGGLEGQPLWSGQSSRERAIDVFSQMRVWDTEHNSGVLLYVQLADRSVEIIADRGIHARTGGEPWRAICRDMELAFSKSEFQSGSLTGIAAIANVIGQHFPAQEKRTNELPDVPVLLT
jgi:uncharacterized membrane protein YgcG